MCGSKVLGVQLLLAVLVLCVQYCKTEHNSWEDVEGLIMPNKRQSINDCHFRFYKYAQRPTVAPAAANGRPTYLREFAHMAAIGWSQPDGVTLWNCGGSLIWDNFVLTAAHCAADSNNEKPDVARFGDLNLYDDSDNEYAQQRTIVEVIRHPEHKFSKRYHDIALMRLEKSVRFHDTVAPACLWNGDEIRFKTMEATGWGDTGYAEKRSPILLKVALSLVDPKRCSQHYLGVRGLRDGLQETQMCAGDIKMDTCPGDSGGPLQVKLLHNTRVTPFVVGVTSFGAACGQSVPGVYTRVAPYIPWIQSTLNQHGENVTERMLEPQACALRYVRYREFEPAVILGKRSSFESLEFNNANLLKADTVHHVTIHSNQVTAVESEQCYGVIFDETTVVTLAQCTSINGTSPTHIRYEGDKISAVAEVYKHPKYEQNSSYNNIGVLKLKDAVKFSDTFVPVCLSLEEDSSIQKLTISGKGSLELNDFNPDPTVSWSNTTVDVLATGYIRNVTHCPVLDSFKSHLAKGLTEEHLCLGSDLFLVPGSCKQILGGPIQTKIYNEYIRWYELTYVYALSLYGKDCGYGESAVGVKIAHHSKWLESILLPKEKEGDRNAPFIFVNSELGEGDLCEADRNETDGICVAHKICPKKIHEFQIGRKVQFCHTGSLVCCPQEFVRNETDAEWRELDECEFRKTHIKARSFKESVISFVWNSETEAKTCIGTIITSRTIVVAANCVFGMTSPADVTINQGTGGEKKSTAVERIIIHPEFDMSTKRHNIALLKMKHLTDVLMEVEPICLWTNATHTPFYLTQVLYNATPNTAKEAFPTNRSDGSILIQDTEGIPEYSSDCYETFGRIIQPYELCVFLDDWRGDLTVNLDAPVLWKKEEGSKHSPSYLIGIASHKSPRGTSQYLHSRISSYVSWIRSVL